MQVAGKPATYEDLLALPDGVKGEVIEGSLVMPPAPLPRHSYVQGALARAIGGPFDADDGRGGPGGWWILSEVDVRLSKHDIVRPDAVGWKRNRLPNPWDQQPIEVVPDWIAEVLSSDSSNDRVRKRRLYARAGVPHYWILDPVARSLEALELDTTKGLWVECGVFEAETIVRVPPFGAVDLDLDAALPTKSGLTPMDATLDLARSGDEHAFRDLVEPYRRELRAHCYRMAGSLSDADDLLQESMLRAWKGLPGFEGRSSVRTWLHRVTHSACIDALERKPARVIPIEMGPAGTPDTVGAPRPDLPWLEPCPETMEAPVSPEARYTTRESVALAFLAALQLLPPRQRGVLLLRDVLGWTAEECAEALDLSVASVNSLLQRARDTVDARSSKWKAKLPDEATTRTLLSRYVQAWERTDHAALVMLLRDDATLQMPPLAMWLQGSEAIGASIAAMVFVSGAAFRSIPTRANGLPAIAMYQRGEDGLFVPAAIHVLSFDGDRLSAIDAFLDTRLFERFRLPPNP